MKKKIPIINISLLALIFAVSIWAYYRLPARVASHWNVAGQVDGYTGRFGGSFALPIVTLAIYLLFLILPKIDPKKQNVAKFLDLYYGFITVFIIFMIYMHLLTLAFNIGYKFDFTRAILPALAGLFYYIGYMLPQAKPNWFLGIRTPWTLSSDEVWRKTHEEGGRCFKLSGLLALLGIFFAKYAIFFLIVPVLAASAYLVVYSYLEFQKQQRGIK